LIQCFIAAFNLLVASLVAASLSCITDISGIGLVITDVGYTETSTSGPCYYRSGKLRCITGIIRACLIISRHVEWHCGVSIVARMLSLSGCSR
jgi:hypothetical protein